LLPLVVELKEWAKHPLKAIETNNRIFDRKFSHQGMSILCASTVVP